MVKSHRLVPRWPSYRCSRVTKAVRQRRQPASTSFHAETFASATRLQLSLELGDPPLASRRGGGRRRVAAIHHFSVGTHALASRRAGSRPWYAAP